MRYFLVEGKFNNPIPVSGLKLDALVKQHLEKLKNEVENSHILFTASKTNNTGIVFLMKCEEKIDLEIFINNDPLNEKEVQKYTVTELKINDINEKIIDWI
ncbi:MAG: hypothetical protein E7213_00185 [Clostridium sp.]|nr:hypothetical protein [Clostridium sp.]